MSRMTFAEFQASRRFCLDLAKEFDGDELGAGFTYDVPAALEDDPGHRLRLYVVVCADGSFDISYDGYPAYDVTRSLELAERRLFNCALEEEWGIEGDPVDEKEVTP